ncbi:prolipoprotein diacylglyceryl transferase [Patescibacteria group bacterium]|nr:MAG: prolipoprotein diacylglyceryl transferase [Patescibacteria group bacterium]
MLPYFHFESFSLGPLTIHVWGLFVSLGILAAVLFGYKLAKKYFLSGEVILDMGVWMLIGALIMARVFHVIFYDSAYYAQNPGDILKFWQGGASSLGGFFGAGVALYLFVKIKKFTCREIKPYLDIGALSLWLGWGVGRLGCFFTHLHPGRLSNFFLAVNLPDGARFDLGLLESILGFTLFAVFYLLFTRLIKKRWGLVALYSVLSYAAVRFFFDFLRATDLPVSDARYFYFTPAQWGMLALIAGLTFALFWGKLGQTSHPSSVRGETKGGV